MAIHMYHHVSSSIISLFQPSIYSAKVRIPQRGSVNCLDLVWVGDLSRCRCASFTGFSPKSGEVQLPDLGSP